MSASKNNIENKLECILWLGLLCKYVVQACCISATYYLYGLKVSGWSAHEG